MMLQIKKYTRFVLNCMQKHWDRIAVFFLSLCILCSISWYNNRQIPLEERSVRNQVVQTAQNYLGCREEDGSHQKIVDLYNSHEPRARDYMVTYEDSWCATFVSAVALDADFEGWIPLECSCEQQIYLFQEQNRWVEADHYYPVSGDLIYYDWNSTGNGDCQGWSDHVGIVVQTFGGVIKVIEGNKNDDVSYRCIFVNDPCIRGYATPDYAGFLNG